MSIDNGLETLDKLKQSFEEQLETIRKSERILEEDLEKAKSLYENATTKGIFDDRIVQSLKANFQYSEKELKRFREDKDERIKHFTDHLSVINDSIKRLAK